MKKLINVLAIFLMTFASLSSFACDVAQSDLERGEQDEPVVVVPDPTSTTDVEDASN